MNDNNYMEKIKDLIDMELLKKVHTQVFQEMVSQQDKGIVSAFEIFEINKDKGELIENLKLCYQSFIVKSIMHLVQKNDHWDSAQKAILEEEIQKENSVIMGAYGSYLSGDGSQESLDDFLETLNIYLQTNP